MMTVSAVARLMPRPPARVERRKQNCCAPGAEEERQVPSGVRAEREGTGGQQRAGREQIQEGRGVLGTVTPSRTTTVPAVFREASGGRGPRVGTEQSTRAPLSPQLCSEP